MSSIDWGIVLGVIGLLVSVYFGMKALKSRKIQTQRASGSGTVIQSGRDTKVK
jgi:hypothetical protein